MSWLWKLPVLYICENNKYAMGTSIERHAMNTKFYTRGDVIPGLRIDGNNFFHVKEGIKWVRIKNNNIKIINIIIVHNHYRNI